MKDILLMWRNTRMVVLTAICAAVYVAVLIPFKLLPIIPGFTEVRPAAIIPIVCSILFGPAAAWGAGFGNVIGDFIGAQFGPGSIFGFFGNFLLGYVPYKLLSKFPRHLPAITDADKQPKPAPRAVKIALGAVAVILAIAIFVRVRGAIGEKAAAIAVGYGIAARDLYLCVVGLLIILFALLIVLSFWMLWRHPQFVLIVLVTCSACSTMIGWGLNALGLLPFAVLANITFVNNLVLNSVLTPSALRLVYHRVKKMGLLYGDVMGLETKPLSKLDLIGVLLLALGAVGGMVFGNVVSMPQTALPWALSPFIGCMVVAVVLL